jgi:hypothetical protein
MKTDKNKLNAQDWDLRVRDRHLASGLLEPKTVERHLAELPDVEALCETLPFDQPALGEQDDA